MARRYYLTMLSVAGIVLVLATVSMSFAGYLHHLLDLLLGAGLMLVLLNLVGARIIFNPIARYLDTRTGFESARDRIPRLAGISAGWAFLVVSIHMFIQFFLHHARYLIGQPNSFDLLILPTLLIAVFGAFMGLFVYFLVGDFTARLREDIFNRFDVVIDPGSGHIRRKLTLAFVAVSAVPMTIFFLRFYHFGEFPHFQVLESTQLIEINLFGAAFLTITAIVFIGRNLTRPLTSLLAAMRRLGEGALQTRAPVTTDDEVGSLTVGFNAMAEQLERQAFLRETFGKFVPESIVTTVLEDRGVVRPQLREATILFTDIEGFTAICEKLEPQEIVAMLNEYFSLAAQPIRELGGVITQFQGDAMLVSFNLPVEDQDHAANAIRAALEIQRLVPARRFAHGIPLNTRIGINTGPVVGGTVGDGDRLGYTVHGDTVNLAARLEQLNKEYGSRILISQRTAELAGKDFEIKEVGRVSVRGHEQSVVIYEVPVLRQIEEHLSARPSEK